MSSAALARSASKQLKLHRTIESIRSLRRGLDSSVSVGFVPTMGALHAGHLSLVNSARSENDVVVASVFVNPAQFAPGEDLDKYPRQLERDSELLSDLGVVRLTMRGSDEDLGLTRGYQPHHTQGSEDHLFAPDPASMYGENHVTYVEPEGFDNVSEGRSRPGHFRGVATIVTKLFNIVRPTNAYFGQKDAAQCVLIRRIVEDLNMDLNVVVKDTVREADGLAMSSRNTYLTEEERRVAPIVYQSLCAARDLFQSLPTDDASIPATQLQQAVTSVLQSEPLITDIQYVAVDNKATMQPLESVQKSEGAIVSLACKLGSVRLIDNIVL